MNNLTELCFNILFNPASAFKNFDTITNKIYKIPLFFILISSLFLLSLENVSFNAGLIFTYLSKTIFVVVYWLFFGFFVDLIARIFRNESNYRKLLALLSFSFFPWIFLAPLHFLKNSVFSYFAVFLMVCVWCWTVFLQIMAISETYNLSKEKAVTILLLPFLASILYLFFVSDFFVKLFQILV